MKTVSLFGAAATDRNDNKVGDVDVVLLDKEGKVTGLVIGAGGFLGVDQKDVIVPFSDVKVERKNNNWWLTINETKDALKARPRVHLYPRRYVLAARQELSLGAPMATASNQAVRPYIRPVNSSTMTISSNSPAPPLG